ncbi:MAG: NAD(P)-binding protein [Thiotrichales bacterium]
MATSQDDMKQTLTFRKFEDGEHDWGSYTDKIFEQDHSHKCPVYVQRTPPCQGSCPSGHDIRGWLDIVRGIEKPSGDMTWEEYSFQRATASNPFPSVMGRVCPAPCQEGCNRNEVEDYVGINAVEQFIGDYATEHGFTYGEPGADTGKKVAVIGSGPGGLTAAFQLRKLGHAATVFEMYDQLGGMMRYGIPKYRIPLEKLDAEINRILDMGVEVRTNTKVGVDITVDELEKEFDAVVWAIGCSKGRDLPVAGWDKAPNCVTAVDFLKAFADGRMKVTAEKVVCIGGGDTSIDVVSVTRRIGSNSAAGKPEDVVLDRSLSQDESLTAGAKPAAATLTSLMTRENMFAQPHEIKDALHEGVELLDGVMPLEVIVGDDGRATGLKVCDCEMDGMTPIKKEGTERVIDADLIVSAIGQLSDVDGVEDLANDRGFMEVDRNYQIKSRHGHFAIGDILRPHLLTTAIGHAGIAVESIDQFLKTGQMAKRPKVDKHHFSLQEKLAEAGLSPSEFSAGEGDLRGTSEADFAVHNFENRSEHEVIKTDRMFLAHFEKEDRILREELPVSADDVLGNYQERMKGLSEEQAQEEAGRCMSCGLCFECDNCVIFCPQDAVYRVKKNEATTGRYVATDYTRCIGCHICSDVCPTGYIDMAMGE